MNNSKKEANRSEQEHARDELVKAISEHILRQQGVHPEQIERQRDKADAEKYRAILRDASKKEATTGGIPKGSLKKRLIKIHDLSNMFADAKLTEKQQECASLSWEYRLSPSDIARKLGVHRTTVIEHLKRAKDRIDRSAHMQRKEKHRVARKSASTDTGEKWQKIKE